VVDKKYVFGLTLNQSRYTPAHDTVAVQAS
jgi:hypothetical protein